MHYYFIPIPKTIPKNFCVKAFLVFIPSSLASNHDRILLFYDLDSVL